MKKALLPSKRCAVCGLPFTWRKRWARCWDEVRYCSERCRRSAPRGKAQAQRQPERP
ncbi:DUF2256 domain-containing protein [Pseudomonas sp. Marseille-P9899]|uniref:DUF2256 domain-containing protein n=1 Tax=Pseudomonas sp. Marseille-P9899 TaxID=2730401 RepID=UPI00158C4656|nr:DUF2256 domain-containing protein [Pseudomonas sp. Marseille-P9899]